MSESEPTIDYFAKFAYLPTQLSNGTWTCWKYYWVKSVHYEPPLKGESILGYPVYTSAHYSFLTEKEYEKDIIWQILK